MFIPRSLEDHGVSTLTTPGQVYFVQGEESGRIKIGWATDPKRRLVALQDHSPVRLKLLYSESGTGRDERALHAKFKELRCWGEWFAPGPDLQKLICDKAGYNVFYVHKRRIAL